MNFQLFRSVTGKYTIPFASTEFLDFFDTSLDLLSNDAAIIFRYFEVKEEKILFESLENSARNLSHFEYKIRLDRMYSSDERHKFLDVYAVPVASENGGILWDGALVDLNTQDLLLDDKTETGTPPNRVGRLRAKRDELTGLLNKTAMLENLALYENSSYSKSSYLAALFIDIDNFGYIAIKYGPQWSDVLLKDIANRFTSVLRSEDDIARDSWDKFLIVIKDLKDEAHCHDVSLQISNRIRYSLMPEFSIEGENFKITCSVGVAFAKGWETEHETDVLTLAEVAMYQAKANGKNTHYFFDKKYNANQSSRLG